MELNFNTKKAENIVININSGETLEQVEINTEMAYFLLMQMERKTMIEYVKVHKETEGYTPFAKIDALNNKSFYSYFKPAIKGSAKAFAKIKDRDIANIINAITELGDDEGLN